MFALDEITKEKQRVSEVLARVDAQRERLTSQLSELEATERVLACYSKGTRTTRSALTLATRADAPALRRRRRLLRPQDQPPASAARRASAIRCSL